MRTVDGLGCVLSQSTVSGGIVIALLQAMLGRRARAEETPTIRLEFLSKNGNSSCTKAFLDSIPTMPSGGQLQGSCCSPMELSRYIKQTESLTKYRAVADNPP